MTSHAVAAGGNLRRPPPPGSLDQAGTAPGDEQFQQAYARGIALSFDQTISFALDELRPST
jgi:hypothetical protein